MSAELRRVQETGGGTLLLSLPKAWARRNNVKKGSFVAVIERADGCLVIDPRRHEHVPLVVSLSPSPNLEREILGRYLAGADIIEIAAKGLDIDQRERVKQLARWLVGLEIVEEDANKIVMQCLLEPSAFPPDKILRREYLIAVGMFRDAIASLLEGNRELAQDVIGRDEEVDRLYFLLVRVLRTLILNPRLSEKLGIALIDCLDYRLVASVVETIGDNSVKIARSVISLGGAKPCPDLQRMISEASNTIFSMYEDAMRAFFTRDTDLAGEIMKRRSDVLPLLSKIDLEIAKQSLELVPHLSAVSAALGRLCDQGVDLAELVVTP